VPPHDWIVIKSSSQANLAQKSEIWYGPIKNYNEALWKDALEESLPNWTITQTKQPDRDVWWIQVMPDGLNQSTDSKAVPICIFGNIYNPKKSYPE